MNVELAIGIAGNSRVVLDGQDVSNAVSSFDLHSDVRSVPTLVLHMPLQRKLSTSGEAQVAVAEDVHVALVALGWTPPPSPHGCADAELIWVTGPDGTRYGTCQDCGALLSTIPLRRSTDV